MKWKKIKIYLRMNHDEVDSVVDDTDPDSDFILQTEINEMDVTEVEDVNLVSQEKN